MCTGFVWRCVFSRATHPSVPALCARPLCPTAHPPARSPRLRDVPTGTPTNRRLSPTPSARLRLAAHSQGVQNFTGISAPLVANQSLANFTAGQSLEWDAHALFADPQLTRSAASVERPWERSCTDYAIAPTSPVWGLGFRPIDVDSIGPCGWDARGRGGRRAR